VNAGTTTVTEVAAHVHLSPSTVVGIIDRLEEKGLVNRERDTTDRRVVTLTATDRGSKLIEETPHPVQALFDDRDDNTLDEDDYDRIATALEDIVSVLGADSDQGDAP